jgi:hypothetical protein
MNTAFMKNRPGTKQSLVERYDCGPVKLSGDSNAFYERHVTFDQVVAESETSARDKFEAIARSVRDMLSQRWLKAASRFLNSRRLKRPNGKAQRPARRLNANGWNRSPMTCKTGSRGG